MNLDLSHQTALVTGASRGLGRAIAFGLAEAGAEVLLMSRDKEQLEQLAHDMGEQGHSARAVPCDVKDVAQVQQVIGGLGKIEILVNNAGTNIPEPFVAVSEAHFDQIFDLNLRAAFFVAQATVQKMLQGGKGGVIINLSSQMGHVGAVNRTVYCASKHALEGFTKALALELAPQRIRVNSVAPTFIETDMTRPMFANSSFQTEVLSKIPLGHLGQPQDVAGAVLFLVSPAASMITGTSLLVDGGWTAQ